MGVLRRTRKHEPVRPVEDATEVGARRPAQRLDLRRPRVSSSDQVLTMIGRTCGSPTLPWERFCPSARSRSLKVLRGTAPTPFFSKARKAPCISRAEWGRVWWGATHDGVGCLVRREREGARQGREQQRVTQNQGRG